MTYRDTHEFGTSVHRRYNADGTEQSSSTYLDFQYDDYMSSGDSPKVNGKRVLQENVMTARKFIFNAGSRLRTTYNGVTGNHQWIGYNLDPWATSDSYQKAAAKFYSAAGDLSLNVAQAFAESQQTIDLVAGTASRIAGAFRDLRHGNVSGAAKRLGVAPPKNLRRLGDDAASAWLSLQYGWKPLLQDVEGAMIATVPRPILIPIRSSSRSEEPLHDETSRSSSYEFYSISRGTRVGRTTIVALLKVEKPEVRSAAALGLTNPALLAWELVPYSFVVDWFLPIGNYLESLTALSGLEVIRASTTTTTVNKFAAEYHFNSNRGYGWPGTVSNSSGTFQITAVKRSRVLSIPNQQLPRFKNPLSVSHLTSSLALLTNVFSSSKSFR